MKNNVYAYILVMAVTTYLIRVLPLTLIRKPIKNKFIRSFLYYVPYVTLSVMTFPSIITATSSIYSGAAGFLAALVLAFCGAGLLKVAVGACGIVFLLELFFV
ncbi:MAG: AzlD domain-containing protein [Lachnospiraceae bacterium]|jgi:branched-subunit amino acid transport protein|nr:AzlD domain-containing protein [Lachnospiraceae bacterium]